MGNELDQLKAGAATCLNLLGNNGNLLEVVQGVYDPAVGDIGETVTAHPTKYVTEQYTLAQIETGVISERDVLLTFQTDLAVDETWRFQTYDGKEMELINISRIGIQDGIVIYQAQARGTA